MEGTLIKVRLVAGGIYKREHLDGTVEFATCTALRELKGGFREGYFSRYPFTATGTVREGEDNLNSWTLVYDPVAAALAVEAAVVAVAAKPKRGRPPKKR